MRSLGVKLIACCRWWAAFTEWCDSITGWYQATQLQDIETQMWTTWPHNLSGNASQSHSLYRYRLIRTSTCTASEMRV